MADYQLTQTGAEVQTALDKVGTVALTTTATDLSGAVNELDGDISSVSAQGIRYFPNHWTSVASGAEILRITNASITTDTVVLECTFNDPNYITGDVTWTSYAGYVAFVGTCTTATLASVTLAMKVN